MCGQSVKRVGVGGLGQMARAMADSAVRVARSHAESPASSARHEGHVRSPRLEWRWVATRLLDEGLIAHGHVALCSEATEMVHSRKDLVGGADDGEIVHDGAPCEGGEAFEGRLVDGLEQARAEQASQYISLAGSGGGGERVDY